MLSKLSNNKFIMKSRNTLLKNKPKLKGHIDGWNGQAIYGWFIHSENVSNIDLLHDDVKQNEITSGVFRKDLLDAGICDTGNSGFEYQLDINELRSKSIESISIISDDEHLIGSPLAVKELKAKGYIDHIDIHSITGWIYDESYPDAHLKLDIYINDKKVETVTVNQYRQDLVDAGVPARYCGFNVHIGQYIDQLKINTIDIKFFDTDERAFPQEFVQGNSSKTASLMKLQNLIKKASFDDEDKELLWLNQCVIPSLIDGVRQGTDELPRATSITPFESGLQITDVIIPVYRGVEETLNCIKSVFDSKCDVPFNVVVINDCSPEPELTSALRDLEKTLPFKLLENEENLGFVQTVNRGMQHAKMNDVLLLNSDTVVTDYWLDRIVEAAYSDSTIGTVTPFSNNATICSYPRFCADNELPKYTSLATLADTVAKNDGIIDLPTAHGFSMFIKRQALKEVGLFDDQKWGKGYAEENDFSLRAARLGWRNVMATNAFVHHLGSVSFAEDSSAFIAKNLEKLNSIYPDYTQSVEAFIKEDPIRPYRNDIAVSLMHKEVEEQSKLVDEYEGSYVFVSLTIGGGTEVATNDLSAIHLKNHRCVFNLVCPQPGVWELKSQIDNSVAQYRLPQEKELLLDVLRSLNVTKFHIHHTLQFDKDIWELPKDLGVKYDVTLHDYYTTCPRVNLIDDTEFYCGEPNSEACNRCIKKNGVHASSFLKIEDLGGDIQSWRRFFENKLQQAEKVITPSFDAKERILKYFDLSNIEAIYHPEAEFDYRPKSLENIDVVNIAFIGAIGVHKGLNVLKEWANYAYKFNFPVKFTVIGYTSDDRYFDQLPNVFITGKYNRSDLTSLIKHNEVHVAALLSVWPETYSYTLSEAMRNNLQVVCLKLGAIPERLPQAKVLNDYKDIFKELDIKGDK